MNECKERKQKTDLEGLLYFIKLTVPYCLCFSHTLTIEIEKNTDMYGYVYVYSSPRHNILSRAVTFSMPNFRPGNIG